MITVEDLDEDLTAGIVTKPVAEENPDPDAPVIRPAKLTPDSSTAQALWKVWSGEKVTIMNSPPGGGKTESVVTIIAHLVMRAGLMVTIVTPTRRGAYELAARLSHQVHPDHLTFQVTGATPPPGVSGKRTAVVSGGHVTVRTIASCKRSAPEIDLLVVDEAYQTTFSEIAAAANKANQILMVGDPGQIGPVVTVDTTLWDRMENAPHRRAPEVFSMRKDSTSLSIDKSYRLGQATVEAISCLYDFPFTSARIPRTVTGHAELESYLFPATGDRDNVEAFGVIADLALSYVGKTRTDGTGSKTETVVLEQSDVAIVVSHNSQVSIISGLLAARGAEGIVVATADRMQGGQWSAVIALDPAFGYAEASPHALATGRLCVMASRHMATLLWVHDGAWRDLFVGDDIPAKAAQVGIAVREALTSNDVTPAKTLRASAA